MRTPQPVMCALEDTTVSRHAARAAAWLAGALDIPLVLVHVFDPMGISVHSGWEMPEASIDEGDLERAARRRAERVFDEVVEALSDGSPATELAEGRPVPELLTLASERRARLLVTGTASRTGISLAMIGSVTSELAAAAPCPVVTVTRGAELEERGPVLAGYDGSGHSLRAARHAAALAARMGRNLVLLHAAHGDERVDANAALAEELYGAAVHAMGDEPGRRPLDLKVSVAVEEGDPVGVLSNIARERSAAMIVTGTRGRGALESMLLGSVSTGLVHAAGRPVMLVPATVR